MSLYPPNLLFADPAHPQTCDFDTCQDCERGVALRTKRHWRRGDFMARFDGMTLPTVYLHTLQKREGVHLYDPYFIGLLAHSCDPNVMLDMDTQQMWAIKDIEPGTILSMDYAATEDHLFRTFDCACGSPNCRGHITGRKQKVA